MAGITYGKKQSHRDGLYQCKPFRRQFSITVGTVLERLRVPLSTWVRAAHAFGYEGPAFGKDGKPPLTKLETEIGVSYRTVLRMRDIIKRAATRYKGHKTGFGAWPRSFMRHKSTGQPERVKRKQLILANTPDPKDHSDTKPSGDFDKNLGEALAKFDFSHTDLGSQDLDHSQGPDHSEVLTALASMSSDDALDYAISQMGPADHLDVGHSDMPADTSHDA